VPFLSLSRSLARSIAVSLSLSLSLSLSVSLSLSLSLSFPPSLSLPPIYLGYATYALVQQAKAVVWERVEQSRALDSKTLVEQFVALDLS
jgi:hypothetical protein